MATPIDAGTAFLEALREISSLLKEWIAGSDIRRMKAAIQFGEEYIRKASPILKEKLDLKQKKEFEVLEVKFFKYN